MDQTRRQFLGSASAVAAAGLSVSSQFIGPASRAGQEDRRARIDGSGHRQLGSDLAYDAWPAQLRILHLQPSHAIADAGGQGGRDPARSRHELEADRSEHARVRPAKGREVPRRQGIHRRGRQGDDAIRIAILAARSGLVSRPGRRRDRRSLHRAAAYGEIRLPRIGLLVRRELPPDAVREGRGRSEDSREAAERDRAVQIYRDRRRQEHHSRQRRLLWRSAEDRRGRLRLCARTRTRACWVS